MSSHKEDCSDDVGGFIESSEMSKLLIYWWIQAVKSGLNHKLKQEASAVKDSTDAI